MSFAYQPQSRLFPLPLAPTRSRQALGERSSDCWPDWSTPHNDAEIRAFAARNRPSAILGEMVQVLATAITLIVLVQALLR